jgi:hypothetical protein
MASAAPAITAITATTATTAMSSTSTSARRCVRSTRGTSISKRTSTMRWGTIDARSTIRPDWAELDPVVVAS